MTTAADDTAVEEAFEASLAGRPVAAEGAGVASFAAAVRATATRPGRPTAALAELLATGLLVDQPAPSPRAAPSRRRRRLAMLFPALLAKLLSAGAVAQAATGAGVAVVVVCSAGAAGVLPGPVQETFSSIVGTGTTEDGAGDPTPVDEGATGGMDGTPSDTTGTDEPGTDPTGTGGTETGGTDTGGTGTGGTGTGGTGTGTPEVTGPDPAQPFGRWLNGRVEHGEVDGRRVSDWAHERNEQRRNPDAEDGGATPEAGEEKTPTEDGATVQRDRTGGDHRGTGRGGHGDR
jgi:hypothetical protein